MHTPNISDLYRLPFSKNDNPNGWVEITTDCNLKCPGCYRGCDRDDNKVVHESFDSVSRNIDEIQRIRNCQIISLSGGEPLLHPELTKIINHIHRKGMLPFVHTNGTLLNIDKIKYLKRAGLAGLIIRVDSLSRNRSKSEMELNDLRQKFGEMVSAVKGIHLTFLCVVNKDNIDEIPTIIEWSLNNARLVDFITFIPMRQVLFDSTDIIDESKWIYLDELCTNVYKMLPTIKYAAFLGSLLQHDKIQWLQAPWIVLDNKILGFPGPKFVEFFQTMHHLLKGKYAYKFGKDRSYINLLQIFLLSLFLKSLRPILKQFILQSIKHPLNLFRRATVQLLCYIIPPDCTNGIRDECDGCPDAILYKGKLYPSCSLEQIKAFELESVQEIK